MAPRETVPGNRFCKWRAQRVATLGTFVATLHLLGSARGDASVLKCTVIPDGGPRFSGGTDPGSSTKAAQPRNILRLRRTLCWIPRLLSA